jgi:hypothetical protein
MVPGVYIGRTNTGDYSLVSTGDYLNPVSSSFKLKDTKTSIDQIQSLYVIINHVNIDFVKLTLLGQVTSVRCFLSWDSSNWATEIVSYETVDATSTVIIKPFFIKIIVDDFLEYFKLVGENIYRQYKIRLMWI